MHNARFGIQANVIEGKIYVIGGLDLIAGEVYIIYGENEVYDLASDSWSYMAQIPTTAAWYASAVLDDKIYIIGGFQSHQNPDGSRSVKFTNLVQVFDPKTNTWTQGTPMSINMSKSAGCATDGITTSKRIYVVGGILKGNGQEISSYPEVSWTQIYDPETGNWSMGSSLHEPRSSVSLVNLNGELYALGGSENTVNEVYTVLPSESASPNTTQLPSPSPSSTLQPTLEPTQTPSPKSDGNQSSDLTTILRYNCYCCGCCWCNSLL